MGHLMILVKHLLKHLEKPDVYAPVFRGKLLVFGSVSENYRLDLLYFKTGLIFCNWPSRSVGDSWCNILGIEGFWVVYRFQSRENV